MPQNSPLAVSVIVPVYNEEGAAVQVAREIEAVFSKAYGADGYEIVMVDDRSSDLSFPRLQELKKDLPTLRVLRHETNAGKSAAILVRRGDGSLYIPLKISGG